MADMRFTRTELGAAWPLAAVVPLAWLFWRLLSGSAWPEVAVLSLLVLLGYRILLRLRELSRRELGMAGGLTAQRVDSCESVSVIAKRLYQRRSPRDGGEELQ